LAHRAYLQTYRTYEERQPIEPALKHLQEAISESQACLSDLFTEIQALEERFVEFQQRQASS